MLVLDSELSCRFRNAGNLGRGRRNLLSHVPDTAFQGCEFFLGRVHGFPYARERTLKVNRSLSRYSPQSRQRSRQTCAQRLTYIGKLLANILELLSSLLHLLVKLVIL